MLVRAVHVNSTFLVCRSGAGTIWAFEKERKRPPSGYAYMTGGWRFKKGLQASIKIRPTQQNRVLRQNCFVHIRPQGTGTARQ